MPDYIRVKFTDSKTEQTIVKPHAIDEDAYTVLDAEAVDLNGDPLPPKFPATNKSGQKAATQKES